ncbi:MAG: hypothetical protein HDS65_11195 [Bacteroidales bacterium]|nr:hypothetical protein [Bacteroidales bacterium]
MKILKFTPIAILSVAAAFALSSCSKETHLEGQWMGNPERIAHLSGASDATATMTLSFDQPDKKGGTVMLSAVIEVEQGIASFSTDTPDDPYETSVTATANATGKYVFTDDDYEDIAITLDPGSFSLSVDPSGVTFAQNIIDGQQQPVLDSLAAATAAQWKTILTPAARELFNRYTTIDDIKIHHDDIMSCEIDDRDYTLRRVGVPD